MTKFFLARQSFASIAYEEGKLSLKGNENKAGQDIEKYLTVFREIFSLNNSKYLSKEVGYEWCCAYVYYLLKKVDYSIDLYPLTNFNWHLGSVRTWYEWALESNIFKVNAYPPLPGDLVLFNHLIEPVDLDHIGIVIKNHANSILTSEGNYHNCSGIFEREKNNTIKGYISLWPL